MPLILHSISNRSRPSGSPMSNWRRSALHPHPAKRIPLAAKQGRIQSRHYEAFFPICLCRIRGLVNLCHNLQDTILLLWSAKAGDGNSGAKEGRMNSADHRGSTSLETEWESVRVMERDAKDMGVFMVVEKQWVSRGRALPDRAAAKPEWSNTSGSPRLQIQMHSKTKPKNSKMAHLQPLKSSSSPIP